MSDGKLMKRQWSSDQAGVGEVAFPSGGTLGPRTQLAFQLVLLHSGGLRLTIDGITTLHEAGNVLLLLPGHVEYFEFASDSPTRHSWLSLKQYAVPKILGDELCTLPSSIPLSRRIYWLTRDALYWTNSPEAGLVIPSICHLGLSVYLAELRSRFAEQAGLPEAICVVERFIRFHFREELSLADLASQASVTAEHLCRLFKNHIGKSPMAALWEFRTERALDLLSTTGLSVSSIAERCGFKTSFHLHQRVKDITGLSPTEYRNRPQG